MQQAGRLLIAEPRTGEVIADHPLTAPGEVSVLDQHYDGPRPAPSRGPRPKTPTEKAFCALGAEAEAFLIGAAAAGNTRLGAELDVLLALGAAHGQEAFIAALRRAVAFKRFRAEDVRSIRAAGLGTAQPRPAGDAWSSTCPPGPDGRWLTTRWTGWPVPTNPCTPVRPSQAAQR